MPSEVRVFQGHRGLFSMDFMPVRTRQECVNACYTWPEMLSGKSVKRLFLLFMTKQSFNRQAYVQAPLSSKDD